MRKIILCVIVLLLYFSNNNIFCQESKFIGKYKFTPVLEFPSDTIILELKEDGKFEYTPYMNNYLGLMNFCRKTEGVWNLNKGSIIINSNLQSTNLKECIKKISIFEPKDSIKIQFINFSDSMPIEGMSIILYNKQKDKSLIRETNKEGVIVIPSKGYYTSSLFMDQVGNKLDIRYLKGGNYYQIIYFDCYPYIFINEKLKINGDHLIRNNQSGNIKELYFKVNR
ncbi:MAG: hypothetical protein PHO12_08800 [Bacteroidales bacterium]|nr:hypothetical protein [Bacteroidales bacterium]MDD4684942.1 hypothetical protein [Bacteroidales bacterium]